MNNRVLVIASESTVAMTLTKALQDGAYEARVMAPGAGAGDAFAQLAPALVLVDLCGDEAATLQALAIIQARNGGLAVPVLLIGSGREHIASVSDARAHGAQGFLIRPVSAQTLVHQVNGCLQRTARVLPDPHVMIPAPSTRAGSVWRRDEDTLVQHTGEEPPPVVAGTLPLTRAQDGTAPGDVVHESHPPRATSVRLLSPAEGTLADGGIAALLWNCMAHSVTGRLDLARSASAASERSVYFEEGRPVGMTGSGGQEDMGELLVSRGHITREQLNQVHVPGESGILALADHLSHHGVLSSSKVMQLVTDHLNERWCALGEWSGGAYSFRSERAPVSDRVDLGANPRQLMWRLIQRAFALDRLERLLGSPASALEVKPDAVGWLNGLKGDEATVFAPLPGARTLEQAVGTTGQPRENVYQVVFLLVTVGLAKVVAPQPVARERTFAGSRAQELEIDRRRVLEMQQRCRHADYFTILGLHPDASRTEVVEALRTAKETMDPTRFQDGTLGDLQAALHEITVVLGETAEVLLDDATRQEYRAHVHR